MASPRKRDATRTVPPEIVDRVLAELRVGGDDRGAGASGGGGTGSVVRYGSPANLREDEVVVLVLDRNMAVAQRVRRPAAASGTARAESALGTAALRLAEMELVASEVLALDLAEPGDAGLTAVEDAELRRGGFEPGCSREDGASVVAEARAEYASVLAGAVDVGEAARMLGVNESRIRQRLGERSLFGFKDGAAWRIPRFQFRGKRILPSLPAVLQATPADIHPVALKRWLTSPCPDLPLGPDDAPASPLDWLASGGDPAPVVALARAL